MGKKELKQKKQSEQIEEEVEAQQVVKKKTKKTKKVIKKVKEDSEEEEVVEKIEKKVKVQKAEAEEDDEEEEEESQEKHEVIIQALSYDATKEDIEKWIIEAAGGDEKCIVSVKVLWDNHNNRSRGTAFAVLKTKIALFHCTAKLNNSEFMGRTVRVMNTADRKGNNSNQQQQSSEGLRNTGVMDRQGTNVEKLKASKTVRVRKLNFDATEEDIQKALEKCGKIAKVRLEKYQGKSRGYGNVDFEELEGAQNALEQNGMKFMGRELIIDHGYPEKPQGWREEKNQKYFDKVASFQQQPGETQQNNDNKNYQEGQQSYNNNKNEQNKNDKPQQNQNIDSDTIFVGNLDFEITEAELKEYFDKVSENNVESVRLAKYEDGSLKGFGFVQFKNKKIVQKGVEQNGVEFRGRNLITQISQQKQKK